MDYPNAPSGQPRRVRLRDDQIEQRKHDGLEIAHRAKIEQRGDVYIVSSLTRGKTRYTVVPDPKSPQCTCVDYETTQEPCKHIYGVRAFMQREQDVRALASPKPPKPTYRQNWPAYNAAQTNETYEFRSLLYDLCKTIPEPERRLGRPRTSLADAVFAAVFKVYSTRSGRRVISQLTEAFEQGYLEKPVHFNVISSYLEKPELTPILRGLIVESAKPLRAVETNFAVDSTGFTGSRFIRWTDVKYRGMKEKAWTKLHVMVGVKTHIVSAAIIEGQNASDAGQLQALLDTTAHNFDAVREVFADKGYAVVHTHQSIAATGARAYIPFKTNATGARGGVWEKAYHYYMLNRDDFLKHYHQRSNVETAFMMMKTKFGDSVRSKIEVAMANEVYAKVLAHNIYCLIQSMYELGIAPEFLATTLKKAS